MVVRYLLTAVEVIILWESTEPERIDLLKSVTARCGGVYLYTNIMGCDGGRAYYDNACLIAVNGEIVAQESQFSLNDVEVVTATVDLDDVHSYRASLFGVRSQSCISKSFPRISIDFSLSNDDRYKEATTPLTDTISKLHYYSCEEEIALGAACWLWDYLRRSSMSGYFLVLDGSVDSLSAACIVYSMCVQVCNAIQSGNELVLEDLRCITDMTDFTPTCPTDICKEILITCCMTTEALNGERCSRIAEFTKCIGCHHYDMNITTIVNACIYVFSLITGFAQNSVPGNQNKTSVLQDLRCRIRMVMTYLFAQLSLWARGRQGSLLVLGSGNITDALRGSYTKYGISSADISPTGGLDPKDLQSFLKFSMTTFEIDALKYFVVDFDANKSEPEMKGDEKVAGLISEGEWSIFGKLRKVSMCGPYSMFCKLLSASKRAYSASQIADKLKYFFDTYSANRHKMTTLTPMYHAEASSPDDNRHDLRQFLYPAFTWQYRRIDETVKIVEEHETTV